MTTYNRYQLSTGLIFSTTQDIVFDGNGKAYDSESDNEDSNLCEEILVNNNYTPVSNFGFNRKDVIAC